ncbi:hypothetical protein BMJ24_29250, partial [Sinorhizobium medicae]
LNGPTAIPGNVPGIAETIECSNSSPRRPPAHWQSRRSAGPFVAINCDALPAGIFASEVLGRACLHRRAADRSPVLAAAKGDLRTRRR